MRYFGFLVTTLALAYIVFATISWNFYWFFGHAIDAYQLDLIYLFRTLWLFGSIGIALMWLKVTE